MVDKTTARLMKASGELPSRREQFAVRQLDIGSARPGGQSTVSTGAAGRGWQAEAWDMYDTVGELRFVAQWLRNSCARVSLYAAQVDEKGQPGPQSEDLLARSIVAGIGGGPSGQAEMMSRAVIPLMIPGEFYIAILSNRDGKDDSGNRHERDETEGDESWHILTSEKVTDDGMGTVTVTIEGKPRKLDPATESVFQVLSPHPRDDQQSDSPVRAALPILREIRAMDNLITSAARSRVAGNGLLLVPKEINQPGMAPGLTPGEPAPSLAKTLTRRLVESMERSVDAVGDPESMTPLVLSVNGDQIDQFRHMEFSHDLTQEHRETRERAIRRLALSLDVPAEVLLGLGDSTHWNADLVDKQATQQHIAPMLTLICDALTKTVLRPALRRAGINENSSVVWYDMSPLSNDTDMAEAAVRAFEAGVLSREALLKYLGFDPEDMATVTKEDLSVQMITRAPSLYVYLWESLPGDFPPPTEAARLAQVQAEKQLQDEAESNG